MTVLYFKDPDSWFSATRYISPISVHNLPRLRTLIVDTSNERKWFYTKKYARSRRYSTQNITDANYVDAKTLLENTHTQAGFLLHSLEQAAGGIGLCVNADQTKYMRFT